MATMPPVLSFQRAAAAAAAAAARARLFVAGSGWVVWRAWRGSELQCARLCARGLLAFMRARTPARPACLPAHVLLCRLYDISVL
jgi:hypothetical protein